MRPPLPVPPQCRARCLFCCERLYLLVLLGLPTLRGCSASVENAQMQKSATRLWHVLCPSRSVFSPSHLQTFTPYNVR